MAIPQDEWRLLVVAVIGFMLAMFVLSNEPEGGEAALWYIWLLIFWAFTFVGAKGNQGINKNWKRNIVVGAFLGGLFIVLHSWEPSIFRLGYPQTVESARFLIVGLIAPIAEELAFRQGIFKTILRDKKRVGLGTAIVITSVIFAAYHWTAYGQSLGTSAALLGAGLFSVVACWTTEETKDATAAIVMHIAANLIMIWGTFSVWGI